MRHAIEISERSIAAAMVNQVDPSVGNFERRWVYFRFRWVAKFCVWWVNKLGPGKQYSYARYLGETL